MVPLKISAELHYLRMAPRKVRLAATAIRGKRVPEALQTLHFLTRRAASPLAKLLRSAVANAKHNYQISEAALLLVSEVRVDGGPTLKRRRPRARGRAFPIKKRTSHVRLVLSAPGGAPSGVRGGRTEIKLVGSADKGRDAETPSKVAERHAARATPRPKVATKSLDFVHRMFRRKAI